MDKKTIISQLDTFTRDYIVCALWSSTDDNGESLDKDYELEDIVTETLLRMQEDCKKFQEENRELLSKAGDDGQNGQDFWLTRNGHGAGFWDHGYGEIGEKLTEATTRYGDYTLFATSFRKIVGF